ncbi:MAG: hypothetical protein WAO98_02365, partial [Alphaproteobacteria bacterium]
MGNGLAKNMQVLSPKDADLYRIAFLAHQKSDWKSADIAISNLTDKRLLGHVLADRYQRRTPSLVEMKEWLINYGNLPEADDMYEMARKMPGAKKVKLTPPTLSDTWSGSD